MVANAHRVDLGSACCDPSKAWAAVTAAELHALVPAVGAEP